MGACHFIRVMGVGQLPLPWSFRHGEDNIVEAKTIYVHLLYWYWGIRSAIDHALSKWYSTE